MYKQLMRSYLKRYNMSIEVDGYKEIVSKDYCEVDKALFIGEQLDN